MKVIAVLVICLIFLPSYGQSIRIMIDPGHGGSDPGHESLDPNIPPEKDLTLLIAKKFGAYLTEKLSNVEVIYTRTDDSYPSLDSRVEMANSGKIDYFISIHINGSPNKSIHGTETHVHSLSSKSSVKLARSFENEFRSKAGRKSRGVKDSDDREHSLQVLKFTQMTSVLVECGFITHARESAYLSTDYGQDIIASALFRGMRSFLKEQHPKISFEKQNDTKAVKASDKKEGNYYSIQILSSKEWLDTEKNGFEKLDKEVERVQVANSGYKYKYFSGRFDSAEEAKQYCEKVKKMGYPDSIVVQRTK
jgi:N-acetylmuramoyl-L-alanine amidase